MGQINGNLISPIEQQATFTVADSDVRHMVYPCTFESISIERWQPFDDEDLTTAETPPEVMAIVGHWKLALEKCQLSRNSYPDYASKELTDYVKDIMKASDAVSTGSKASKYVSLSRDQDQSYPFLFFHVLPQTGLRDTLDAIYSLLKLHANWDGFNAEPISISTVSRTIDLIENLWKQQRESLIIAPIVSPCGDGSILLRWEINKDAYVDVFVDDEDVNLFAYRDGKLIPYAQFDSTILAKLVGKGVFVE